MKPSNEYFPLDEITYAKLCGQMFRLTELMAKEGWSWYTSPAFLQYVSEDIRVSRRKAWFKGICDARAMIELYEKDRDDLGDFTYFLDRYERLYG